MPFPSPLAPARPALLLLLLLAACGRPDAGAPAKGSPPAVVVRAGERGVWAPGAEWRLREEVRIGASEGPGAFGRVVDVESDTLGRIWVADGQAREIRVFDAAGHHVRTVGRRGSGPGEFLNVAGMARSPDGRLWVLDGGNARFTVLDTAGAFVGSASRPGAGVQVPWPGAFDARGRLVDPAILPGPGGAFALALVRYDTALRPADTLRIPLHAGEFFESEGGGPRGARRASVPFTGVQVWAPDPRGGAWVGISDRYRLHHVEFGGDTSRVVEKPHESVPVTADEVERALGGYGGFEAAGGRVERGRIPRVKPPVAGLFTSEDGHLWVASARRQGEPGSFDVFQADGRYLGRVASPVPLASTPAPVARGDALLGVVRDENGVESVVRLRIEKPR